MMKKNVRFYHKLMAQHNIFGENFIIDSSKLVSDVWYNVNPKILPKSKNTFENNKILMLMITLLNIHSLRIKFSITGLILSFN